MTTKKKTGGVPDANRKTPPVVLEQLHGSQNTGPVEPVKQKFWILEEITLRQDSREQFSRGTRTQGPHAKGTAYSVRKPPKPRFALKTRNALYRPMWMDMAEKWDSITPGRFRELRRLVHNMSVEQCAAYLRVGPNSIWRWEQGVTRIPYAAYIALRLLADLPTIPHQITAWKGWKIISAGADLGMLYDADQTGVIVSPVEIRQLPWIKGERDAWKKRAETAEARAAELEAENTRLRELYRAQGVTRELRTMQARIDDLLDGLGTADLLDLPIPGAAIHPKEKAA